MMAIGLLLPFFIIMLIIFLSVRGGSGNRMFFMGRYLKRVWLGYLIILLLSPIALYAIQGSDTKLAEIGSGQEVVEIHDDFFASLYDGGKIDFQSLELKEEFEFDLASSSLKVAHGSEDRYSTVIIEKNKALDEKIIARIYVLPSVVDNYKVTQVIPMPQVEFSNDRLELIYSKESVEVNMRLFEREFTIKQFTDHEDSSYSRGHMSAFSDPYLYLQIPEDVTVLSESDMLELIYLGK